MKYYTPILTALLLTFSIILQAQNYTEKLAILKYSGGDWYSNPTALSNLAAYCNRNLHTQFDTEYDIAEISSIDIFNYPFIHMTGHGNVFFSNAEAQNLRLYLLSGGFLHIDDNYGMDKFIRSEIKKVFPEYELTEVPSSHPIFHQHYNFPKGLPKIHEHDNKPPQALGIFHEGKLLIFYTLESDIGDGWEDAEVHNDPAEVREKALQMGANIVQYVFMKNL